MFTHFCQPDIYMPSVWATPSNSDKQAQELNFFETNLVIKLLSIENELQSKAHYFSFHGRKNRSILHKSSKTYYKSDSSISLYDMIQSEAFGKHSQLGSNLFLLWMTTRMLMPMTILTYCSRRQQRWMLTKEYLFFSYFLVTN